MEDCIRSLKEEDDGFSPQLIPLSSHRLYYSDSEMEHHYPNMYDFRRAAMMNTPSPLFAPYNRTFVMPKTTPPYLMFDDYRKQSDWLSIWADCQVRHMYTNPALTKLPRF